MVKAGGVEINLTEIAIVGGVLLLLPQIVKGWGPGAANALGDTGKSVVTNAGGIIDTATDTVWKSLQHITDTVLGPLEKVWNDSSFSKIGQPMGVFSSNPQDAIDLQALFAAPQNPLLFGSYNNVDLLPKWTGPQTINYLQGLLK